jgi:cytochrome P450
MEKAWVAIRDEDVEAAFMAPELRVRPVDERVPSAMRGTALGVIFERLARMNDGERHSRLRAIVEATLMRWDIDDIRRIAFGAAASMPPREIAAFTVATMIGLRDPERLMPSIVDFANAVAPGANAEVIARGITATQPLIAALPPNMDPDEQANLLGLLFQTYAATAKLIENRLAGRTDAPAPVARRYAADDLNLCGTHIARGDSVVMLLSSSRFQFGFGAHACPGRRIAETIADAVVNAYATRSEVRANV